MFKDLSIEELGKESDTDDHPVAVEEAAAAGDDQVGDVEPALGYALDGVVGNPGKDDPMQVLPEGSVLQGRRLHLRPRNIGHQGRALGEKQGHRPEQSPQEDKALQESFR